MWDLVGNPEDRFSHNKAHIQQIQDTSQQQLLQRLIGEGNQTTTVLGTDNVTVVPGGQQVINTLQGSFNQPGHIILAGGDTPQLGSKAIFFLFLGLRILQHKFLHFRKKKKIYF